MSQPSPATPCRALETVDSRWFARDANEVAVDLLGAHLSVASADGLVTARLATALGLTGEHDGRALGTEVSLRAPGEAPGWDQGPRTGIRGPGGSGDLFPWRYWISGDPTVSRYRAA